MELGKWFHRLFNPHCPDCRAEYEAARMEEHEKREESKVCVSCDMLKEQLNIANTEKERLLARLLDKPETPKPVETAPKITRPVALPWRVRQQMLEKEDRERAKLLANAPKPLMEVTKESTEDLEKELDIASAAREAEATNQKT